MHTKSIISDARRPVHPNSCRSSSLKHMDKRSYFEQHSFGNFSRGDSNKLELGNRAFQKSSVLPVQSPSIGLSPGIDATFGSVKSHRTLGCHGWNGDGGRHSRDYVLAESASFFGLPCAGRADSDKKYERNFFGEALVDNPQGASGLPGSRSHGKENTLLPAASLSSMQGEIATVPVNIKGSLCTGTLSDAYSSRDSENMVKGSRSQMSSQTSDINHEPLLPGGRGCSSGRACFSRPGFKGELASHATDLEVKVDTNQSIIEENAAVDSFPSKGADFKYVEKSSFGRVSSINPIDQKKIVTDGKQKFPGFLDSALLSTSLISPRLFHLDTHGDESSNSSCRKRPRLGWGQGLAKYEKKKGVEPESFAQFPPFPDKIEADAEASEVEGILASAGVSSMNCNTCAEKNVLSDMNFCLNVMECKSEKDEPKLEGVPARCKQLSCERESWERMELSPQMSDTRESWCWLGHTHAPQKVLENESEDYNYLSCDVPLSKKSILSTIEKLEFDIDYIERELANVDIEIRLQDPPNQILADITHQEGASYPESALASEPHCVKLRKNMTYGACMSPLKAECTVETAQLSLGADPHTSTVTIPVDADALEPNLTCEGLGCTIKSLDCNVSMDGNESLLAEESLPLSTSATRANGGLGSPDGCSISNLYQAIIQMNRAAADNAGKVFLHHLSSLLMAGEKLYSSPDEAPTWLLNKEAHEKAKEELKKQLEKHKKITRFKEQLLVLKHQTFKKIWRQEQSVASGKDHLKGIRKCDNDHRNWSRLNSHKSSSRSRQLPSGVTKYDSSNLHDRFSAVKLFSPLPSEKRYLKMPAMIVDEGWSYQRFVTRNALVDDPVAVEQERKTINPWTQEEKRVFLEAFATYNKDFAKIASYLPQKTVADCIEFYYQNQKTEDFEMFRRQHNLKKKKDFNHCKSYLATVLGTERFRESNVARVDGLSFVASLASSDSFGELRRLKGHNSKKLIDETCAGSSKDLVTIDVFGANNLKSASKVLISDAGVDSGCALALCSLSNAAILAAEKGIADMPSHTECFNKPSFNESNIHRSVSMRNDSLKVTKQDGDSHWSDSERQLFVHALKLYGKSFSSIALQVGTKTVEQCIRFFSKTRKRLGLDEFLKIHALRVPVDYSKDVSQKKPISECVEGCINFNVATTANLFKDKSLTLGAGAKPLDFKRMHSNVDNVPSEEQTNRIGELQGNCAEDSNEKRLQDDVCDNISGVLNATQLVAPDICSESKNTVQLENNLMSDGLPGSNLLIRMGDDHLDRTLSAMKGDIDARKIESSELEVKKAENDETAVIGHLRMDGVGLDAKGVYLSERNMEDDPYQGCVNEGQMDEDSKEISEVNHEIEGVGTIEFVNSGDDTPATLVQSSLVPLISSFTSSNILEEEICTIAIAGVDPYLRTEPVFWTSKEKERFADIIHRHGKCWPILQKHLPLKSLAQIKTYFQNSKTKLGYEASQLQSNKAVKAGAFKKRKVDDSDTISNAGSVGQQSGSFFLKDSVYGVSMPRLNSTLNAGLQTAGPTDQEFMDSKSCQIAPEISFNKFNSTVSIPTVQVPVSSNGTPANLHMIPSATSYSRFDSASDFSPKSYDCQEMSVPSQVFGSNLQNPEQVVHHTENIKSFQQDPISQQNQQHELLGMLQEQQQQLVIYQTKQHQKVEVYQSQLLLSQNPSYSDDIQTARAPQLQQASLTNGLHHLEVLQSKGSPFKQLHMQSLHSEVKCSQTHDTGRITTPYFSVIQHQSSDPEEQFACDEQKSVNPQVANHALQRTSQQPEAQFWQPSEQFIHQKEQEQKMIEFHLQQQENLQQHLKFSDKNMSEDHQLLVPLRHDHQFSKPYELNQPHPADSIRNQQLTKQQRLLQFRQETHSLYPGIREETEQLHGSELRNSLTQSRSTFVETKPAQAPHRGDIKLFGQSLLLQPPSPALQSGMSSIADQNSCQGNLQPPLDEVPALPGKESCIWFGRQSVEVALPSTGGNTKASSSLSTRINTAASDSNICDRAWIGLQINAGDVAAAGDIRTGNIQVSSLHREFHSLSNEDSIMAGKEHGDWNTTRPDALCVVDKQACLVPSVSVGRVDATPGNTLSGSSGGGHLFLS